MRRQNAAGVVALSANASIHASAMIIRRKAVISAYSPSFTISFVYEEGEERRIKIYKTMHTLQMLQMESYF